MPRLRYEIDIPDGLGELHFPPLMLVSLAENAVKHGVEPKVGPALIRLSAARDAEGRLAVTVADDGVGFGGATAGSGLGLANLKDRLQQLYRGHATLTLRARPEGGVAATIAIPAESETA
jgi:sensor histidine kinase YesM